MVPIPKILKTTTLVVACILGGFFLLLLVDKGGTITGKMTAVTSASVLDVPLVNTHLWLLVALVFFVLVLALFFRSNKRPVKKK